MKTTTRILTGDVRVVLPTLASDSVDCVVTSPPYWLQRDYGCADQIGQEDTLEEYVDEIVGVFDEVRRVLKNEGTCWVNLGDSYASNAGGLQGKNGCRAGIRHTEKRMKSRRGSGLKRKDLCTVPQAVAAAMRDSGWYLRSDIIWLKPSAIPERIDDRPTQCYEHIYLFSKSQRYYYDSRAVREPTGANLRNVWIVPAEPSSEARAAMMPKEIVRRCVLLGSPQGATVMDPFGGAGTTAVVSDKLGRNAISIELNPSCVEIAHQRLTRVSLPLFESVVDVA